MHDLLILVFLENNNSSYQDVDCMPFNPLDNMPEALRRQNLAFDKLCSVSKEFPAHGYSNQEGSIVFKSNGHMENGSALFNPTVN